MALTKIDTDVENISKLPDRPNQNNGLSAAQLKGKFDLGVKDIKAYINETLTVEIDEALDAKAETEDITAQFDAKVDKVEGKGLSTNDYDNEEKESVASNTLARHTHDNKLLLDDISNEDLIGWDNAFADSHTHSNKTTLDTYTQTETDLSDAVSKKHSHANMTALNSVSGVNTGDQDLSDYALKTDIPSALETIDGVVTVVVDDDTKLATSGAIVDYVSSLGGGDMLKTVYDTDGDGKVDSAENADTVGGFTVGVNVPADAVFTDTVYTHPDTHPVSMITGLTTTANITYYVSPTGSDSNDGLTSGTAFKTIQKAIDSVPKILNHTITISVAAGTYDETVIVEGFVGSGTLNINGSSGVDTTRSLDSMIIYNNSNWIDVRGFCFVDLTQTAVYLIRSYVNIQNCTILSGFPQMNTGIEVEMGKATLTNNTISERGEAIKVTRGGYARSVNNSGTGNKVGLFAGSGGTIVTDLSQPSGTYHQELVEDGGQVLSDTINANTLAEQISTKASFKNGTGTFPSGTTFQVTDTFITANTLIIISPTSEKQGTWSVESNDGSFTITSDTAETTAVTFDWGATK